MHSMHQLRVSNETSSHLQQSQGLAHETNSAAISPERRANMTVLVKPDGAQATGQVANQPILSVLEPVQQQQQPMSDQAMRPVTTNLQAPPVSHHLMQQQQQQPQPHLHLLGAPRSQHEQDQLEQQSVGQQHEQQEGQQQPARSNSASGRQRQQIEGIMGDGGGPIVQWLVENYEIAEGESLPRSTVYNHYINHCRRLCLASVNAASFGKMIRSVFVGLKTRRLGTRGHSKYHYFGIRAKRTRLEWTQESDQMGPQDGQRRGAGCSSMMGDANQDNSNTDQGSESDSTGDCHDGRLSSLGGGSVSNNATNSSLKRLKRFHDAEMNDPGELGAYGEPIEQHGNHFDGVGEANQHYASSGAYYSTGYAIRQEGGCSLDQCDLTSLRQHLGANSATLVDEHWPQVEAGSIERQLADRLQGSSDCGTDPTGEDLPSLVQAFEGQYKLHYKRLIDLLGVFQFNEVEHLCSEFWHPSPPPAAHETVHQWASSEASTNGNEHEHEHHHHQQHQHQHQHNQRDHHNNHHHHQHQHHHLHQAMDADQQLAQQQQQALVYGHHNQDQQMLAMSPSTNLTFNQLYQLTSQPEMIERINQIDRKLYSAIERFLMPDMLGPAPRPLIQHIRIFCRDISAWMEAAIKDYTGAFVAEKLKSIRALEHTLRRRSSINHLSTCARSVWNKRSALAQMSLDLSRIDLRDIEHQVSLMSRTKVDLLESGQQNQSELFRTANELITQQDQQRSPIIIEHDNPGQRQQHRNEVIQSDSGISGANKMDAQISHQSNGNIVNNYLNNNGNTTQTNRFSLCRDSFDLMQPAHLIQNFLHLLEDPYPANIWPDWCRSLVESRVCGQSFEEARNFILKWSFHVSLILRELTLRSAPSLGSFQLIRLLFDEYMYHLVVVRLAQAQHKTPIQMLTTSIKFDNIQ